MKISNSLTLALLAAVTLSLPACADMPGKHPFYLHAMSDLREARGLMEKLDKPTVDREEEKAILDIEAALHEMKHAAIDDGKDIFDHKPVDKHWRRTDRFHQAEELLNKALSDVAREEDDPAARGLQARIVEHLEAAKRHVHRALEDKLE